MTIDPKTLAALQHQGRRMHYALEHDNRREVELIHRRVDQLLDGRPAAVGETDGEVVYDNASPWVQAQVTEAVNTGEPEPVLTPPQWYGFLEEPDDDGPEPNGGGVGLLDRP